MIELEEYKICKKRGHTSSGGVTSTAGTVQGPSTLTCKFCGVNYYYMQPEMVEINPPAPPEEPKNK
jgi:hypothetical protein